MLSALGDAAAKVAGIQAGARHYITKPFRSADLVARVQECLRAAPRQYDVQPTTRG
jgi:two-component system response regulator PrrA